MGSTKVKVQDMNLDEIETKKTTTKTDPESNSTAEAKPTAKRNRGRSRKYIAARSQVDKTQTYPVDKAVELVKKLSRAKHPTITADINLRESGLNLEISLPHSTGKQIKVAIADETVLKQIEAGQLDFDVLLAKPDMMGKIAKHAKVLGPRGLMPNPKNNTVTTDPEKRKKELEAGSLQIKAEKKAPVCHIQIGQINQPDQEVAENVTALARKIGLTKIAKLTLSSTMSPGIKVELNSLKAE